MKYQVMQTTKHFAMAGPLVGGALFFISMAAVDHGRWTTGLSLGLLNAYKAPRSWPLRATTIGFVVGFVYGTAFDLSLASRSSSFLPLQALFYAIPSGVSALVCALIFKPAQDDPCA